MGTLKPSTSNPLPWAGMPPTKPGCLRPHPTWPWKYILSMKKWNRCLHHLTVSFHKGIKTYWDNKKQELCNESFCNEKSGWGQPSHQHNHRQGRSSHFVAWWGRRASAALSPHTAPGSRTRNNLEGWDKCLHHLGANGSVLAAEIHLPTEGHVIPPDDWLVVLIQRALVFP